MKVMFVQDLVQLKKTSPPRLAERRAIDKANSVDDSEVLLFILITTPWSFSYRECGLVPDFRRDILVMADKESKDHSALPLANCKLSCVTFGFLTLLRREKACEAHPWRC